MLAVVITQDIRVWLFKRMCNPYYPPYLAILWVPRLVFFVSFSSSDSCVSKRHNGRCSLGVLVLIKEGWKQKLHGYMQGRSVPYARTQVLPHRFDNLKKKKNILIFFFFFRFYS